MLKVPQNEDVKDEILEGVQKMFKDKGGINLCINYFFYNHRRPKELLRLNKFYTKYKL